MTVAMIYWALIVANDPGFVGSVHRTSEPCRRQVAELRRAGIVAVCHPTTQPDVLSATHELKSLATLLHDKSH